MTDISPVLLFLQGIVFLAWAVQMFITLFALRRLAAAERGATFPGLGTTLRSWGVFLTAPEWRARRRWLGLTTLALVAIIAANALILSARS